MTELNIYSSFIMHSHMSAVLLVDITENIVPGTIITIPGVSKSKFTIHSIEFVRISNDEKMGLVIQLENDIEYAFFKNENLIGQTAELQNP